jgi:hypothetical protein
VNANVAAMVMGFFVSKTEKYYKSTKFIVSNPKFARLLLREREREKILSSICLK